MRDGELQRDGNSQKPCADDWLTVMGWQKVPFRGVSAVMCESSSPVAKQDVVRVAPKQTRLVLIVTYLGART